MNKVLCSVATRGRYDTTLPMVLQAIANQTKLPNKLIIFDDNDEPQDLRGNFIYTHLFQMFDIKGLPWEVVFAPKKGQHHIHQMANQMGFDWVWRVDDDCVPEPTVLQTLFFYTGPGVGAIGGSILTPPHTNAVSASGKIENINSEPNIQWGYINERKVVEHLHCSFLYRAGVHDYHLGLSRVAHREETLFTYGLHSKGYEILVVPGAVSWHLKSPQGGIRSETKQEMFDHDERIFRNLMEHKDKTIVVLDSGMGDHVIFSRVMPDVKNPLIFCCHPEIVPGRSIAEAMSLFGDIGQYNIYGKMASWGWKDSLESAYRRMYT
jgi:hypothetical protein